MINHSVFQIKQLFSSVTVTCPKGHLSEMELCRFPIYDPNRSSPNFNPNPMPIHFGQTTIRTSELSPLSSAKEAVFIVSSYFV